MPKRLRHYHGNHFLDYHTQQGFNKLSQSARDKNQFKIHQPIQEILCAIKKGNKLIPVILLR